MPNRGDRGGAQTRARIADVATRLFVARGFDAVTVAEVAAAAGVSKVTVFSHFERKEDLLLDRLPDVADLVRRAVEQRRPGVDAITALRAAALAMARDRHPLSGLSEAAEPFAVLVAGSPALVGRLRTFAYEIEGDLADVLTADRDFRGDGVLVAAYRTVAVRTIRRRLDGQELDSVAAAHRRELKRAFAAVTEGVGPLG